jgi:phosphoglycolate phosphatase
LLIIFDLDGTLIDSAADLAISMNATREHVRLPPLDPEVIYSFVGNGASVLVRRALGPDAPEELVSDALKFFLAFYRKHALQNTRLYDGVDEVVRQAAAAGHKLSVLTNKPKKISFDILHGLDMTSFFSHVYGGDSFPAKKPDPIGIKTLMSDTEHRPEDTLMVGDSSVDIETARNAGVRSCGVLWGFQPDTLRSSGPDFLIERPAELLGCLES